MQSLCSAEPSTSGTEDGFQMASRGQGEYEHARTDLADKTLNKLEGLTIHDGIPKLYFRQTWWKKFLKLLGQKTQDGYVLTVVLFEHDEGGRAWAVLHPALFGAMQVDAMAGTHRMEKAWQYLKLSQM